jgi:hypothetical protein
MTLHSDRPSVSFFPFDLLSLIAHGLLLSHASTEQITPSISPLSEVFLGKGEKEKLLAVMEWLAGVASLSTHGFLCEDASWGIPIDLNPIDIKWHPGDYTRLQACIYRQRSLTCTHETLFRSFVIMRKTHRPTLHCSCHSFYSRLRRKVKAVAQVNVEVFGLYEYQNRIAQEWK